MEVWCSIYKHPKKEEMYLYLKKDSSIDILPEALKEKFDQPVFVMDLLLTPERKLARENILTVIENVITKGFHLQLPPAWNGHQPAGQDNNHDR